MPMDFVPEEAIPLGNQMAWQLRCGKLTLEPEINLPPLFRSDGVGRKDFVNKLLSPTLEFSLGDCSYDWVVILIPLGPGPCTC